MYLKVQRGRDNGRVASTSATMKEGKDVVGLGSTVLILSSLRRLLYFTHAGSKLKSLPLIGESKFSLGGASKVGFCFPRCKNIPEASSHSTRPKLAYELMLGIFT